MRNMFATRYAGGMVILHAALVMSIPPLCIGAILAAQKLLGVRNSPVTVRDLT